MAHSEGERVYSVLDVTNYIACMFTKTSSNANQIELQIKNTSTLLLTKSWDKMFITFTPLKSQHCLKKYFLLGGLVKCFFSLKSPKIMKSGWGDWKGVSCHGNQIFYGFRCVACRTIISLPSFNGLCCKLIKPALFTNNSWCYIGLSAWHHQSSHLHI